MNKTLRKILLFSCLLLITLTIVPKTFAFFTTYTRTKGQATLQLHDETRFKEEKIDGGKHVVISVPEGSDPVYVRVKTFAVDEVLKYLEYKGDHWNLKDGWYEYELPLHEKEEAALDITLNEEGQKTLEKDFNLVVVYEFVPASINEAGELFADWSADWNIQRIGG
ncbi:MAG: hypothetical protein IIZ33_05630 [Erysipelotrichaceae bacterium]|nr:hypothetical protein [Erysipelotrichaceae bacterium]